ncbi:hypothetical protein HDU98_012238 [Podochytrium sp. JEL0797]|nr:hypothetical protein HDU98_012238 [Podochytrium sp. JEL0797]
MQRLDGQTCVILGATSDIGLAVAQQAKKPPLKPSHILTPTPLQLRALGANVALADTNPTLIQQSAVSVFAIDPTSQDASQDNGTDFATVTARAVDTSDAGELDQLFSDLSDSSFDHLISIAASDPNDSPDLLIVSLPADQLAATLSARIVGHVSAVNSAYPHLKLKGASPSITLCSASANRGVQAVVGAAMGGLVKVLAREVTPIRVNAVTVGKGEGVEAVVKGVVFMVTNAFSTGTVVEVGE